MNKIFITRNKTTKLNLTKIEIKKTILCLVGLSNRSKKYYRNIDWVIKFKMKYTKIKHNVIFKG